MVSYVLNIQLQFSAAENPIHSENLLWAKVGKDLKILTEQFPYAWDKTADRKLVNFKSLFYALFDCLAFIS